MQIDCYGIEASSQWFRRKEPVGPVPVGKKGLTLPYMLDCICLTTRNGRGGLRGTLRLNARHFEADERG